MGLLDVDALKGAIPLEDLVETLGVNLSRQGREMKGLCPFHEEKTPSFTVTPDAQKYYCFGCGASGDHIDFVQDYFNVNFKEAADRLAGIVGRDSYELPDGAPRQRAAPKKTRTTSDWEFVVPAADVPPPAQVRTMIDNDWHAVPVIGSWAYRDPEGRLHGYAVRIHKGETADGTPKKEVIPFTQQVNTVTGEVRMRQGALPEPRLLYGSELLPKHPKANVIVVEGEKTADAARRLLQNYPFIVLTWPGGGKAVSKAAWGLLEGRKVVGFPDTDSKHHERGEKAGQMMAYTEQPGMAAMLKIADQAEDHGFQFRIVATPEPGKIADGWDLADAEDEGWDGDQVLAYIKKHARTAAEVRTFGSPQPQPQPEPAGDSELEPPPGDYDDVPPDMDYGDAGGWGEAPDDMDLGSNEAFRILGWDRGRAYYLPNDCRQVVELAAGGHTKLNLLQLAPLRYWREWFPVESRKSDGVDWEMAADSLMRRAQRAGIWDAGLVRGRGAWFDSGRSAVHAGDQVVLDGKAYELHDVPSSYVYEAGKPMKITMAEPMGNEEAHLFANICDSVRWERKIFGRLMAGWCFLAPICGALDWRSHIWITGGAGSGKSTVLNKIIKPALGENMIYAAGDTSEAGIRMRLRQDALPVVFDEFEAEREKASKRVEDVMALVTQSSSDTGASIFKGGMGGKADEYKIRSMFAFASISVNMKQHAARTRVTVLSLKTPLPGHRETAADVEQYNQLVRDILDTLTPDYISRLQARAIRMIPVIRENAIAFSEAAAVSLGTRRLGDQVGTLLAGAFALFSTKKITRDEAAKWIMQQDWTDVADDDEDRDESSCIGHILAHPVRVETKGGTVKTRSIGELVELVAGTLSSDTEVTAGDAIATLGRFGLRVERNVQGKFEVWIAQTHKELSRVLTDTAYASSWARVLLRTEGATKLGVKKYAGVASRGVALPVANMMSGKE